MLLFIAFFGPSLCRALAFLRATLSHSSRPDSTIASRPPGHKSLYFRTHQPHPRLEETSITLALSWNPDFSRMGRANTHSAPRLSFLSFSLSLSLLPLYIIMVAWRPSWNVLYLSHPSAYLSRTAPILVHVHVLHNLSPALYLLTHSTLQMHR